MLLICVPSIVFTAICLTRTIFWYCHNRQCGHKYIDRMIGCRLVPFNAVSMGDHTFFSFSGPLQHRTTEAEDGWIEKRFQHEKIIHQERWIYWFHLPMMTTWHRSHRYMSETTPLFYFSLVITVATIMLWTIIDDGYVGYIHVSKCDPTIHFIESASLDFIFQWNTHGRKQGVNFNSIH